MVVGIGCSRSNLTHVIVLSGENLVGKASDKMFPVVGTEVCLQDPNVLLL